MFGEVGFFEGLKKVINIAKVCYLNCKSQQETGSLKIKTDYVKGAIGLEYDYPP